MSPEHFRRSYPRIDRADPAWLKVIEQLAAAYEESGNHAAALAMREDCQRVRLKLMCSDTFTERLSRGYYRVSVLCSGQQAATFYIIRSRTDSQLWSIWSAGDDYHSILLFKTLEEAKEHCINLTM